MLKRLSFLKQWIKKEKVEDIILFGSSVRSKTNPNDLDLCIIISDSDEKRSLDLIDSLAKAVERLKLKVHINILKRSDLVGNTLAKTLLQEGISLNKGKNFASLLGFESLSLFLYSLKSFSPSQRVRFHYMLKGRYGTKGMLAAVQGDLWNPGVIAVPTSTEDKLKEIFDAWKVKYAIKQILLG
jgi:predicted nucleotidyltransferase